VVEAMIDERVFRASLKANEGNGSDLLALKSLRNFYHVYIWCS
jgi:hypothetical protein